MKLNLSSDKGWKSFKDDCNSKTGGSI